ncbi:MAG TPA: DUF4340 domain-containing protein [Nevskia sp.]|nr:DUF4340 domain-containing protein [Nevskia sp.]
MKAQQKLNLVLAAAVLGLGAAVLLTQKKEPPKNPPLTALKLDAINHMVLSHPKAPDIVLDKKDGKWMLTAPVQTAADPFELNSLLSVATAGSKSSIDPREVKLADLGLDPPGFSLTLNDVKVEFGGVEPLNYHRYVMTGGKVGQIDDPPASALDADYSDLVAKTLLPEGARIAAVAVPGLKVSRSADGKWQAEPADPKAGTDDLQKFIDAWAGARSLWNSAMPADARPEANAPAAVVTLEDGQSYTFAIAARDPQLALDRADLKVRYSLAKSDADKLLKLPEPPPAPTTEQKVPADAGKKAEAQPAAPAAKH